nr:cyclic nucleotide-binding domain-containing protein [Acidimicrobiia bacterium]
MLEARLRGIQFLRDLPSTAISAVADQLVAVALPAGADVFAAGDPADALYLVSSGWLSVEEPSSGRELATLGPGSIFGEVGLLLDAPRSATVRVLADAHLWRLARADVDALVDSYPLVGVALGREIGRRLLAADQR